MSHSLDDSHRHQARRPPQGLLFLPGALIWLGLQTGREQDAWHAGAIPVAKPSGRQETRQELWGQKGGRKEASGPGREDSLPACLPACLL